MVDETKNEDVVKDLSGLSQEEKERAWEDHIRTQINQLLDVFLEPAKDCNFNVTYRPVIKENLESGPVFDESKIDAAKLILVFEFKEPVNIND